MNQQSRKYECKRYKQQIEELSEKLEDLAQAVDMFKFPNSKKTQKTIKLFIIGNFSEPPKKNYATNKTDVYHIADICSLDILDLKDYGSENNRRYRYILVVIDSFSEFGWTKPLKNENAQTIKDSYGIILISSLRKPNFIETDRCREIYNNIFRSFLNYNNIKHYSRNTYLGAASAERFYHTIRDLLKKPVFENGDSNWIEMLQITTKQNNNRIHSSTKLTPIQAILQKNEGYVYKN